MNPSPSRKQRTDLAVLFDLYDTLVQPDLGHIEAGRMALAQRAGVGMEAFRGQLRHTLAARSLGQMGTLADELREMLAACGLNGLPAPDLDRLVELEYATWRGGVRLFDDALPTLRRLRTQGVKTAIVSNCSCQAGAVAHALGLQNEVDALVLSFEVGLMKPDPRMFHYTLERLGATPERSVLVDDVLENLDAARALGMRTVLVSRYGQHVEAEAGHPFVRELAELWPALIATDTEAPLSLDLS